jgi:hypothetical protein
MWSMFTCGKRCCHRKQQPPSEKHTLVLTIHGASGIPDYVPNGQQVYLQFKRNGKKFATDNALVDSCGVLWENLLSWETSFSRNIRKQKHLDRRARMVHALEDSMTESASRYMSNKLDKSLSRKDSDLHYSEKMYRVTLKADTSCGLGPKSRFLRGKTIAEGELNIAAFGKDHGDNELEIVTLKLFPPILDKHAKTLHLEPIMVNLTIQCLKGSRIASAISFHNQEFREQSAANYMLDSVDDKSASDHPAHPPLQSGRALMAEVKDSPNNNERIDHVFQNALDYDRTVSTRPGSDDAVSEDGSESGTRQVNEVGYDVDGYRANGIFPSPHDLQSILHGLRCPTTTSLPGSRLDQMLQEHAGHDEIPIRASKLGKERTKSGSLNGQSAYAISSQNASETNFAPWIIE